jgi:uncharacterized protein (TIGR00369 family)
MADQINPIVELFRSAIGMKLDGAPPFTQWLDGRIVSCDVGEMEVSFTVRPEMANPTGLLHGGMQAAIIDDVIGMTSATLGEEGFMLTIDLHVNFLGKVEVGQTVKARARVVRSGKRIAHAVCEIIDENGAIVCRGDSNLVKTGYVPDFRRKVDEGLA